MLLMLIVVIVLFLLYLLLVLLMLLFLTLLSCSPPHPRSRHASQGLEFPWWPKPVEDMSVNGLSNGFHVQEMPSLVVFMEGADDIAQKEVRTMVVMIDDDT